MASTSRAPAAQTQTVLPDEIWEEIFLHLNSTADLTRTSAACSSFRCVVLERRFLRRFRSLRPPAVLGLISRSRHELSTLCSTKAKAKVMAFVFSSCNQTWRGIISTICLPDGLIQYMPYYAHGCFYWMFYAKNNSVMFDTSEMEFSIIDLPPHTFYSMHAIVEAGEGRLGFLTIVDRAIDLYCKNWQSSGVGSQEWLHNKLIPLPKEPGINYHWVIEGTAGHYLALVAHHGTNSEHFLLDMKTLLLKKLCTLNNGAFYCFPYARFPPPLALPSI